MGTPSASRGIPIRAIGSGRRSFETPRSPGPSGPSGSHSKWWLVTSQQALEASRPPEGAIALSMAATTESLAAASSSMPR